MHDNFLQNLKDKLKRQHNGDEGQLTCIFSEEPRIMVSAPAGYGKTTTMISRIAYIYATGSIPNPKKVLALTFSINAALKIKREVADKLPDLLCEENNPNSVSERVTATNYHGFCKSVLKKYGRCISPLLDKDINKFTAVDESERNLDNLPFFVSNEERKQLSNIQNNIKDAITPSAEERESYLSIMCNKFLPNNYITHNAIILFTIDLFEKQSAVAAFYANYYPLIVIDEFQDTNCIAWELLQKLITSSTQLLFLGDSLQRIYGFIGALPNIMDVAVAEFQMQEIVLNKNYRFKENQEMLWLDYNIRENAKRILSFDPEYVAHVPALWGCDQHDEAEKDASFINNLLSLNPNHKVAVLFRGRSGAEEFEKELAECKLPYFYGMFTDDDETYIQFHEACCIQFQKRFSREKNVSKKQLTTFSKIVKEEHLGDGQIVESLNILLDALIKKIDVDYSDLLPEDKYDLLLDIFQNRQLKQAMEYVDSNIVLSTVHGAKGLEWDYVFIADMERWSFPSGAICINCPNRFNTDDKGRCVLPADIPSEFQQALLDELSVFYVALTRARKQVYLSASAMRSNGKAGNLSCLGTLPGMSLYSAEKTEQNL